MSIASTQMKTPPQSLIIVGAGMAGIKLAQQILQSPHIPSTNITILEANDYIGGRVRNFNFEGHTVEMGANWISGLETTYQNPIWKLAQQVQLTGHAVDRGEELAAQVYNTQGEEVTKEYFAAREKFEACHARAVEQCVKRNIVAANDVDVRTILEECGWPRPQDMTSIERCVEYNMLEVWISDSLSNLSAATNMEENANDVDLGGDEFFVEDDRGFNCIMNGIVDEVKGKGAKICLSEEVAEIHYTPGAVCVKTSSGKDIKADMIVSTVSLGVLKNDKIKFVPPIPVWKREALNQIEMFLFSKAYVRFDHPFWNRTKKQLVVCSDKGDHYPLWMRYRNTEENIFMCYIGGTEAKRVESLSNEKVSQEIQSLFTKAFVTLLSPEEDPAEVFRPSAVATTMWSLDPHFCGSYSVYPVHSFSTIPLSDLTEGLTGTDSRQGPVTLHFAGECFDDKFNGWVQGAFRSGERVAKTILDSED